MNENQDPWQIIGIIASILFILSLIFQLIGYFRRKNKYKPFVRSSSYNERKNFISLYIISNIDYALIIDKIYIKLNKFKRKKLGFGHGSPNNKEHSHALAKKGTGKINPIIDEGSFTIYLPINLNPEGRKFIILTNAGKIKHTLNILRLRIGSLGKKNTDH